MGKKLTEAEKAERKVERERKKEEQRIKDNEKTKELLKQLATGLSDSTNALDDLVADNLEKFDADEIKKVVKKLKNIEEKTREFSLRAYEEDICDKEFCEEINLTCDRALLTIDFALKELNRKGN